MTVGIEFIYKSNAGNGVAFRHWGGTHATVEVRMTWLTPSFNLGKIFTDYINDFDSSVSFVRAPFWVFLMFMKDHTIKYKLNDCF